MQKILKSVKELYRCVLPHFSLSEMAEEDLGAANIRSDNPSESYREQMYNCLNQLSSSVYILQHPFVQILHSAKEDFRAQ